MQKLEKIRGWILLGASLLALIGLVLGSMGNKAGMPFLIIGVIGLWAVIAIPYVAELANRK